MSRTLMLVAGLYAMSALAMPAQKITDESPKHRENKVAKLASKVLDEVRSALHDAFDATTNSK